MSAAAGDDAAVVVPPAPGDVDAGRVERALVALYNGRRATTLVGGFGLAALRAAAVAEIDHEPFPLVRRR